MTAFALNLADLTFILKQIKIAEAHSNGAALTEIRLDPSTGEVLVNGDLYDANGVFVGGPGFPLTDVDGNPIVYPLAIPDPKTPFGLRTVDGSYNNIMEGRELWGAADQPMPRYLAPNYINDADGDTMSLGGPVTVTNTNYGVLNGTPTNPMLPGGNGGNTGNVADADPRIISNLVADMSVNNPAALFAALKFAESEDPYADLAELLAARISQEQADAALVAAQDALTDANAALDAAVQAYTLNPSPTTIDGIQDAAAAVTAAEAALAHAQTVADDPEAAFLALAESKGLVVENGSLVIPNIAPDEGISAPFNAWMTFFGQFFDHGLDLITKGGNGTVFIPLQNDDPLVLGADGQLGTSDDLPAHLRFMVLTRSTTTTDENGVPTQINTTTPFVDQNQTYTSHASHQVFLREYMMVDGKPVATGRLLQGEAGGLATWADVKAQAATMLGIQLTDADVLNVPLIYTDAYGEFIRGANGLPQIVTGLNPDGTPSGLVEGNLGTPVNTFAAGAARIGHAFLDDIAHTANPFNSQNPTVLNTADADSVINDVNANGTIDSGETALPSGTYDNELLDRHFITGDGRGNENFGLTAVHHIFHSEHNRQTVIQKLTILEEGDLAFVNEWLAVDLVQGQLTAIKNALHSATDKAQFIRDLEDGNLATGPLTLNLVWDGERIFQAARFATEMQYQHLVFEEFARKIQPAIDPFVFNSVTDINPAIFAEFANVVYRFGHSMLTDSLPRAFLLANGGTYENSFLNTVDEGLIAAFLDPVDYDLDGTISHEAAAGAVVRGLTNVRGNAIDEFVVDALRNNLLGLPLDLAAINIARGRDTGMPSLNQAREQLFAATGHSFLKPYGNWTEFSVGLKNPLSVVNFIAAYGTHSSITAATTLEGKRDAAWDLVFFDAAGKTQEQIDDRNAFINGSGIYASNKGGLDNVDLWIGGLAEKILLFGGMLGSTFTAIFEAQLEALQDADRFYYLTRTQGQNFLDQLENNAFAKMIMANTDLTEPGPDGIRGTADDVIKHHIGIDSFANYDYVLEVNEQYQQDYNGSEAGKDPSGNDNVLEALGLTKVVRDLPPAFQAYYETYLRFYGGEHVVLGGSSGNDVLIGDLGDDAIWGDAGNDYIEGGQGVDLIMGGDGDDVIMDEGDEGDFIKGNGGNDVISSSNGLDILMGGEGKDVVFAGRDDTEVFAGEGDDFVLGGDGVDFLLGNEGDDWLEGAGGFDTTAGDNSELFFDSRIIGHDVMFAGSEEHDFDAESGDDIMVQGESVIRNEGMFGFDWVTYKGVEREADANMNVRIFTTEAADILRNRFDKVEALSGWDYNDTLIGDNRIYDVFPDIATVNNTENMFFRDELDQAGIARIEGLDQIITSSLLRNAVYGADFSDVVKPIFTGGNVLLGGGGSDTIRGGGGDDVIDGDRWLNVRIRITNNPGDANTAANELTTVDSLKHFFTQEQVTADGLPALWVGKSLFELLVAREIVPAQMHIVREILSNDKNRDGSTATDVAVFWDVQANYTITRNDDGSVTIEHTGFDPANVPDGTNFVSDGRDTLYNVEFARFADGDLRINNDPPSDIRWNGVVPVNSTLPANNAVIANLTSADPDSTSWTYTLLPGSSAGFAVSPAGVVTKTGGAMAANTVYTLNIRSTDDYGNTRDETFTIQTGTDGNNTISLSAVTNDVVVYGEDGTDTITGGSGNDTLFGQDEDDTLDGGLGDDVLHGGTGDTDTASYAAAAGAVTIDLTTGAVSGSAGSDTLIDIERVVGSASGDTYVLGLTNSVETIQETNGADTVAIVGGGTALANLNVAEGGGDDLVIEIGDAEVTVTDHYATTAEEVETVTFDAGTTYGGYALAGSYAMNSDDAGNRDAAAGVSSILAGDGGGNTINGSNQRDLLFGNGGGDTLNGGDGDDLLVGGTGNDTINAGGGNDTIVYRMGDGTDTMSGGAGTDTLAVLNPGNGNTTVDVAFNGTRITTLEGMTVNADIERVTADLGAGTDTLAYSTGSSAVTVDLAAGTASGFISVAGIENITGTNNADTFVGNAANNTFNGGAGTDRVVYAGAAENYRFALSGANIEVTGAVTGTDTLTSIEQIQIGATVYAAANGNFVTGTNASNNPLNGGANGELMLGYAGNDVINGNGGADIIHGGDGNDTINAGDGDDIVVWHVGDDRDIVDGGNNNDTVVINGDASVETYRIYTRAAWQDAGNNLAQLNANTEIVITRNGTNNASVIAELDNVEEIVINGATASPPGGPVNTTLGGDTIQVFGDFTQTSLALNTITVNGGTGDDTVDFSALTSAHRIVFRSNGGNDTIVGNVRPQDVIELAPGQDISTYTLVNNGDGTSTFTNGVHSITFTGPVPPQFGNDSTPDEDVIDGAFEYTPRDIAGLKAMVNGLKPDFVGDDDVPVGVRELSGLGNNEDNPTWGNADEPFIRITEARYGAYNPGTGNNDVNPVFQGLDPRTISNILGVQEAGLPKAGNEANIFFMAMGQYIDHGLDFLPKGGNGSIQIGAPGGGAPGSGNPADLTRGTVIGYEDGVPQHKNQTSPYIDQNQAYGSHSLVGQFLREGDGNGGLGAHLFSGAPDPSNPQFKLLPTLRELILEHWNNNTEFKMPDGSSVAFQTYYPGLVVGGAVVGSVLASSGLASNFMGSTHPLLLDANPFINPLDHYIAGDGRANENFALTSIHTIWARNHNHHVEGLKAAGFVGTDEELFQAAKMINEAEYQRVVFDEYLETLLGGLRSEGTHGFEEYDPNANAGISHEFAGAVFRFGHSLIGQTMTVLDEDGNPQQVSLFDAFLNPSNDAGVFTGPLPPGYVPQPGYAQHGVNAIIGGTVSQAAEDVDFNIVDAVRNDLVRISADLFAFNVARGWDLGLGTLNQVRKMLAASTDPYVAEAVGFAGGDLTAYTSWEDFQQRNGLSNTVIQQFQQAYPDLVLSAADAVAFAQVNPDIELIDNGDGTKTVKGIDRLDLWVGGLAEKHINGGIVGQTFWVVLHEQFERLQDGDRFYYISRFDSFDFYENFIDGQEFADIVARNTGMTGLPEHMFRTEEIDIDDDNDDDVDHDDDEDDDNSVGDDDDDDDTDGDDADDDDDVDDDDDADDTDDDDDDIDGDDDTDDTDDDDDVGGGVVLPGSLITGTPLADILLGTSGGDNIVAFASDDVAVGGAGADSISAGEGADFIDAGLGRDVIFGGDDDDQIFGGEDADIIFGDDGADRLFGEDGDDLITAGAGNDTVFGGAGNDLLLAEIGDGDDVYFGDEGDCGILGIDTLDMTAVSANVTVHLGNGELLKGFAYSSQTGYDTLWGIENVNTGFGNDTITASNAVNVMDGGAGNDTFVFPTIQAANGDRIVGFEPGDKIDLSGIDANATTAGNQSFTLLSGGAFTAAGQLSVSFETRDGNDVTVIRGNVNANTDADFELEIEGHHELNNQNLNL